MKHNQHDNSKKFTATPSPAKLKSVQLNKDYQIKFTLNGADGEFLFDMKNLLKYPAYNKLTDISLFINAAFDDDLIFWNLDCDIHLNQLLSTSYPYSEQNLTAWVAAKRKSYYEYAINNWTFN